MLFTLAKYLENNLTNTFSRAVRALLPSIKAFAPKANREGVIALRIIRVTGIQWRLTAVLV